MGYESLAAREPLSVRYRHQFPVTEKFVYLNHASVAPVSRRCAEAMKDLADDVLMNGSDNYDTWLDAYEGTRVAAARLINADRSEIAIVKNTSEGIATVALGIDWRPGDKVVAFQEEFPANLYPWRRLEAQGVNVEWLSIRDSLDRIDEAARGARLLSVSFVQYLSGFRADLDAIGEICRRRGTFFFVDAIQGLGAFPLDVRRAGIDALAADGHKWLLGPEGCGILYIQRDQQDMIQPAEFGWTNVAGYGSYSSPDMALRSDAGRYECGTLNTVGCFGLRAALDFILEVGVDAIAPAVRGLADQIAEGVRAKGYELAVERTPADAAGIVAFRKEGMDSRSIVRQLRDRGLILAPRQGWVRASPHFYIESQEITRLITELP
ncbi:MAG TPA: aminotransferase class V-fold PLP-dependent enzyme [Bryobacteraceae bacterium]|nr:aminotransferase class V-fold PLP-dependent enzyme [Bryobacteraceae bacterium]